VREKWIATGTVSVNPLESVSEDGAFLGRLPHELILLNNTWLLSLNAILSATLLLCWQNVAVFGNLQKSLVRLLELPWQLDICAFVFAENYAGLLIALFVKLFVRRLIDHCLSGLCGSDGCCSEADFRMGTLLECGVCCNSIPPAETQQHNPWPRKCVLTLLTHPDIPLYSCSYLG